MNIKILCRSWTSVFAEHKAYLPTIMNEYFDF